MIIQCNECQTRFRLADEKIKPSGTKVRCSKCKHVFTVTPPEPEPVEESVDFGDFNMEKVDEPEAPAAAEEGVAPAAESKSQEESPSTDELDFSRPEQELVTGGELTDEFSFKDTRHATDEEGSESIAKQSFAEEGAFDFNETEPPSGEPPEEPDFAAAFTETEQPTDTEEALRGDTSTGESLETSDFDFSVDPTGPPEFSFDEKSEAAAADESPATEFETEESNTPTFEFGEAGAPGEFSFDEETSFGEDSETIEWEEVKDDSAPSFDFDEPQFETEATAETLKKNPEDLQFGEIDFGDETGDAGPVLAEDDHYSGTSLARSEEPQPVAAPRSEVSKPAPVELEDRSDAPLPATKMTKRKSPMSRVLLLLVLLFVALGGAAGYLYLQDGGFDLNRILQRFPFLQTYLGPPDEVADIPRIGINISSSTYVNNQKAGQLLVIQGEAVNNYPASRSAITIKGVLLDDKGKTLLQQTVFCGNPLSEERLKVMPFASIEEAMNNQFGDSLSNMNVAAGAKIPFTVVFRNLPEGIAHINIEIVDSKPGSG